MERRQPCFGALLTLFWGAAADTDCANPLPSSIEFIDGLELTASEREMIYEKNARQILRSGLA